ncbi:MAG TPA: 30S ribosomal protein S11 [Candidatus Absconditabacterales bacterium]|nr:30S ribosomal protein S11 [Candidatus Absconditabacterales bacterium]
MATPTAAKAKVATPKKKRDIKLESGVLHVQTTDNNTILSLVDENGNRVLGGGTGKLGYKGSKKSTPYAA